MGTEARGPAAAELAARVQRDLFISYSTPDLDKAHAIRVALEASGYSAWMAPDDIVGTTPWAEQISDAVAGCRAMLVLVSGASAASRHVPKEAELAFGKAKPLIPVRLEDVTPTGSLEYLLSLSQWIDVFPGPLEAHVEDLLSRVARALAEAESTVQPSTTPARSPRPVAVAPPLIRPRSGARRVRRLLFAAAAVAAIIFSILSFVRADGAVMLQARTLGVVPNPVQAGASATAIGSDWAPGAPVEIQWDTAYGAVLSTGVSDSSGAFSVSFVVPAGAAPGDHQVWVCQYAAGTDCSPANEFKAMVATALTVAADNPPIANPDHFATAVGQPLVIQDASLITNDADPDGDTLCSAVQLVDAPSMGVLIRLNDIVWLYTPGPGVVGTDSFTYRVCDQIKVAWSNTARVTIDIVFEGTLSASPSWGRAGTDVTVTGSGFLVNAPVDVSWEGLRVARSDADGTGSFSAGFTVGDLPRGVYTVQACTVDTAACASAGFEVTAPPPPPPATAQPTTTAPEANATDPSQVGPTAADDEAVVDLEEPVVIEVLANDSHPSAALDPGSLRIIVPARFGSAQVSGPGLVTYTAGTAFEDTDNFRYEVCDTQGTCASATVTISLVTQPRCSPTAVIVESFTVDPPEGVPGLASHVQLEIDAERAAGCVLPTVQFLWSNEEWGGIAGFAGSLISVERTVPADASAGTHEITARDVDADTELASLSFTVTSPVPVDESAASGGGWLWPWVPIGVVLAAGGAWIGRRRWRSRGSRLARLHAAAAASESRARGLLAQAEALEAELEECEALHGHNVAVLPTGAWVDEQAGGTEPYLLEYQNPNAPPQEDGCRGWYYPRRKEPIRGIVMHTSEGMALPGSTADRVARYFATCRAAESAHAVVDARGAITLLPDDYTALHIPMANSASLGLVVCLGEDPDEQRKALAHAARWCRAKAADYEFPFERVDAETWRIGGYGVIGHSDLEPGAPDPAGPDGSPFAWDVLLEPGGGPSKFPGLVPVRRGADPCAAERQRAARAREAASAASREAAEAAG